MKADRLLLWLQIIKSLLYLKYPRRAEENASYKSDLVDFLFNVRNTLFAGAEAVAVVVRLDVKLRFKELGLGRYYSDKLFIHKKRYRQVSGRGTDDKYSLFGTDKVSGTLRYLGSVAVGFKGKPAVVAFVVVKLIYINLHLYVELPNDPLPFRRVNID